MDDIIEEAGCDNEDGTSDMHNDNYEDIETKLTNFIKYASLSFYINNPECSENIEWITEIDKKILEKMLNIDEVNIYLVLRLSVHWLY